MSLLTAPAETLRSFVCHSGVVAAHTACLELVERCSAAPESFHFIYLCGPQGAGKSYLVQAVRRELETRGYQPERISCVDVNVEPAATDSDEWISSFVARYEELRRNGGVLIVTSRQSPQEASTNPHLRSRLLAGVVLELRYPDESELRPLAEALLEQRNMRVSEKTLDYLLQRLPADPLSLAAIFDRISDYSLQESRPARLGVVRKIVAPNGH